MRYFLINNYLKKLTILHGRGFNSRETTYQRKFKVSLRENIPVSPPSLTGSNGGKMIVSRCLPISKLCAVGRRGVLQSSNNRILLEQIRNSGGGEFTYRKAPKSTALDGWANFFGAFVWWWVLWHCFTEYEEVIGMNTPDPETFTDEELGIPPR